MELVSPLSTKHGCSKAWCSFVRRFSKEVSVPPHLFVLFACTYKSLFLPFLIEKKKGGGSGFGMYVSAGIIRAHEGEIKVWSAGEGHGATFSFSLPMTRTYTSVESVKSRQKSTESRAAVEIEHTNINNAGDKAVNQPQRNSCSTQPVQTPIPIPATGAQNNANYSILVVDDSHLNRKMLVNLLKTHGHQVFICISPRFYLLTRII